MQNYNHHSRILVFGGAGFLDSYLADKLPKEIIEISVVDKFAYPASTVGYQYDPEVNLEDDLKEIITHFRKAVA